MGMGARVVSGRAVAALRALPAARGVEGRSCWLASFGGKCAAVNSSTAVAALSFGL